MIDPLTKEQRGMKRPTLAESARAAVDNQRQWEVLASRMDRVIHEAAAMGVQPQNFSRWLAERDGWHVRGGGHR